MTDSVAVFPPGYRLTDASTGAPLNGAVIRFYDAGTTNPKTVYADAELTTALGTTVTTDTLGYPTSNGTTKTLVNVGAAPYKIRIETSAGVEVATHDNLKGAVEVTEPTDVAVEFARPMVTKSLDYTVVSGDQSKIFAVNCSGGNVTLTLPSAATVGAGWFVTIQHAGSANLAIVATVSGQAISSGHVSYGASLPMTGSGEEITLVSDGGNWRAISHTHQHIKAAQGIITVEDRLTAPPGSPVVGGWYLISGAPSGDWSSFAANDLVQRVGSTWIKITPPTDCGWVAYVKDEDYTYQFKNSAWVTEVASTAAYGTTRLADQAAMEAASSGRTVTADIQHHHALHPKVRALINVSGTAAITYGYGTASVADNGSGDITLTWTTALTNVTWAGAANLNNMGGRAYLTEVARTSTTLRVKCWFDGSGDDSITNLSLMIWGDAA